MRRDRERKALALHLPRDVLNLTMSYSQLFDGIVSWRQKNQERCLQIVMQWNDYVVCSNRTKLLLFHLIDKSTVDMPNMETYPRNSWMIPHLNHSIIVVNGDLILKLQNDGTVIRKQLQGVVGNIWCFMEEGKFLMSNGALRTTSLYQIQNSTGVLASGLVSLQSWPFITDRAIALSQDRFACFVANAFQIWDLNEGLKVNITFEFGPIYYQQLIFDACTHQIFIHLLRNRRRGRYLIDYLVLYNVSTGKHNCNKPFQFRHIDKKIELGFPRFIAQQVYIRKMQMALDGTLYLLVRRCRVKGSCLVTFDLLTHELKQYTTPSITDFLILHDRRVLCQNRDSLFLLD